jgi:DNA gyrase subunit A
MLMSTKGKAIRLAVSGIRQIGRATQGVHLMKLAPGEEVASMAIIEPRDPAELARRT